MIELCFAGYPLAGRINNQFQTHLNAPINKICRKAFTPHSFYDSVTASLRSTVRKYDYVMTQAATYKTWAITVRPLTRDDVTFLVEKLNKHPGIQGWWGHEEMVNGDESSRHVHLAVIYPKEVLKFTVSKWLKKTLAHTESWSSEKLQWKAGVAIKVWYNDVWLQAYMDGEQLDSKYEIPDEIEYPAKDDTRAILPTRQKKPAVPDRVVARWEELYNAPPQSIFQVKKFIRWMMYTEKSIGFMNKHKLEETMEHVWLMLTEPNDLPKPWGIPDKLKKELLQKVESRKVADNQGPATTSRTNDYLWQNDCTAGGRAPRPPAPAAGKLAENKFPPAQTEFEECSSKPPDKPGVSVVERLVLNKSTTTLNMSNEVLNL